MSLTWSKSPPSAPGLYWVCNPASDSDIYRVPRAVEVEQHSGRLEAWLPFSDYTEAVLPADRSVLETEFEGCLWAGPIERPAPPTAGE